MNSLKKLKKKEISLNLKKNKQQKAKKKIKHQCFKKLMDLTNRLRI